MNQLDILSRKLREEFETSRRKNSAYSLRSFAKKLRVSPATLSRVLTGKRIPSHAIVKQIVDKLGMDPEAQKQILDQTIWGQFGRPKKSTTPNTASIQTLRIRTLQFNFISRWYHLAILSLKQTKGFRDNSDHVSTRLGISKTQATQAIETLKDLGLWASVQENSAAQKQYVTSDNVPSSAIRSAHNEYLNLAQRSLELDELDKRDLMSTYMCFDVQNMDKAKKTIRDFHKKMKALSESGDKKEVYLIGTYFIPLSKN